MERGGRIRGEWGGEGGEREKRRGGGEEDKVL